MTTVEQEKAGADDIEASRMTLGEHLDELRVRLMRATLAFVIAFVALYTFRQPVQRFIKIPYNQAQSELYDKLVEVRQGQLEDDKSLKVEDLFVKGEPDWELKNPQEYLGPITSLEAGGPFAVNIKVCFLLSLFVAGPVLLWEIWMFIAAGLYQQEKRVVYAFLPASMGLFFAGIVFGFMVMVPAAMYFLNSDGLGVDGINRQMSLDYYLRFLRTFTLALGIIFQLPIFQVALARAGMVDPKVFAKYRGHMAVGLLVFAAVITPPDPVTQVMLAGPAIVLWEIGYWVSRAVAKSGASAADTDQLSAPTGA